MGVEIQIIKNQFAESGSLAGMEKAMIELCSKLNDQAKALTPVDQGQLRNSEMYQVFTNAGKIAEEGFNDKPEQAAPESHRLSVTEKPKKNQVIGIQGTNSDHWYIEFGTRKMAAKPFERPAKEIVLDGGRATDVAAKYQREEITRAFTKRKTDKRVVRG